MKPLSTKTYQDLGKHNVKEFSKRYRKNNRHVFIKV